MEWVFKQGRNREGDRFAKWFYVEDDRVLSSIEEPEVDEVTYLVWGRRDSMIGEFLSLDAAKRWCEDREARIRKARDKRGMEDADALRAANDKYFLKTLENEGAE